MNAKKQSSGMAELFLVLGVPVLTLLLAATLAHPKLIGRWEDDGIYLSLATSLANGEGFVCHALPGNPELAKYPPLYPFTLSLFMRLGFDSHHDFSLWCILAFQSLIFCAVVFLFINVMLPFLDFSRRERWIAFILLVVNMAVLDAGMATMSEGLFLLLFLGQLTCLHRLICKERPDSSGLAQKRSKDRFQGWLYFVLILLIIAGCLTRTINQVIVLGYVFILFWTRKMAGMGCVLLALLTAIVISSQIKSSIQARNESRIPEYKDLLPYYTGYDYHLKYYKDHWSKGGVAGTVRALAGVMKANARNGLVSLKEIFCPFDTIMDDPGVFSGHKTTSVLGLAMMVTLIILALTFTGLALSAGLRPLLPVVLFYAAFFLFWTWPFMARFWVPILPMMIMGFIQGCRRFKRSGRILLWGLTLVSASLNAILIEERGRIQIHQIIQEHPGMEKSELLALDFEQNMKWLNRNSSAERGDLLLGGFDTLWKSRELGLKGLWLETLFDPDYFLSGYIGLKSEKTISGEELSELLGRKIKQLQTCLPKEARLLIQSDFTLSNSLRSLLATYESQGILQKVHASGHGWIQVYEVRRGR